MSDGAETLGSGVKVYHRVEYWFLLSTTPVIGPHEASDGLGRKSRACQGPDAPCCQMLWEDVDG